MSDTSAISPSLLQEIQRHLRPSDLIGLSQLVVDATMGITGVSEGAHQAVWGTLGFPGGKESGQTRGITGTVFKSVRGVTRLVGAGLDFGLKALIPEEAEDARPTTFEREAVLSALNGVLGDRMAARGNPLTTRMTWRVDGKALDLDAPEALPVKPGAKLLLLIHGSCMNDLQWRSEVDGRVVDHGQNLAQALGYTPLYLRYNSGRHVSENGRELAGLLESLILAMGVDPGELAIVAHSMGGLVTRSACHYGQAAGHRWPELLKKIVFLGTPHWGAPLERAGNWVDVLLSSTPYSAPYAKLGQIRSAGVTDLRHGYLLDEDWQGVDRFERRPDQRPPLPLPPGIACYTVAATLAARRSPLAERLVGDGLVPLNSALGKHDDASRSLAFAAEAQAIFYKMGHVALLSRPEVAEKLTEWLQ